MSLQFDQFYDDYMGGLNREIQYNFPKPFEKKYDTAMITGHRWFDYRTPIDKLITMAVNQGITHFLCGMALGVDQTFAQCLIDRKLKWTAVIPCADQDNLWKPRQRSHYRKLLKQATHQITLYPTYVSGCMQSRNLWMLKRADICLAVFSGDPAGVGGGTATTVKMARDRNILIYQYIPDESKFTIIEPAYQQMRLF